MFRSKESDYKKISFAQSGEDLIMDFILSGRGINKPTYVDIGAHHPFYLSNTYLFYKKGSSGVCIEPDPYLFEEIKKYRPNDVCLNVGLGPKKGEADFYIIDPPTLNTFSKNEAKELAKMGHKTTQKMRLPLLPIREVIKQYFDKAPNIVSLDVEGMDMEILEQFDFKAYRPDIFCIETIAYTKDNTGEKVSEILKFMEKNKYKIHADTYINTIFVDATKR